jgi:hypothetical protein
MTKPPTDKLIEGLFLDMQCRAHLQLEVTVNYYYSTAIFKVQ